jgi:hypothetical protein
MRKSSEAIFDAVHIDRLQFALPRSIRVVQTDTKHKLRIGAEVRFTPAGLCEVILALRQLPGDARAGTSVADRRVHGQMFPCRLAWSSCVPRCPPVSTVAHLSPVGGFDAKKLVPPARCSLTMTRHAEDVWHNLRNATTTRCARPLGELELDAEMKNT